MLWISVSTIMHKAVERFDFPLHNAAENHDYQVQYAPEIHDFPLHRQQSDLTIHCIKHQIVINICCLKGLSSEISEAKSGINR
jgi:hypothetical protein